MAYVQLDDHVFSAAQRAAVAGGYSSVDEYVADVIARDLEGIAEDASQDRHFTPERLTELDRISAEVKSGGTTYTVAEVEAHFRRKREGGAEKHRT